MRTTPSRATGFSPFFLVYGAEAILPTDLEYGPQGSKPTKSTKTSRPARTRWTSWTRLEMWCSYTRHATNNPYDDTRHRGFDVETSTRETLC